MSDMAGSFSVQVDRCGATLPRRCDTVFVDTVCGVFTPARQVEGRAQPRCDTVFVDTVCGVPTQTRQVEGRAQPRCDTSVAASESAMVSVSTRVVSPVAPLVSSTSPSARARGPIVTR